MAVAKAQLNYARMSPQKVRRVADVVRGIPVSSAFVQLSVLPQRPAPALKKLLASAVTNAKQQGLAEDKLVVRSLTVDEGPVFKRFMPRAHGRATTIRKRTSHITIIVEEA
jgi:large subunit ribosomal protein L22